MILAHPGRPPVPHDLWSAWNADPLVVVGLVVAAWVFWSGRRRARTTRGTPRAVYFSLALLVLAVALLSPLDALSRALASAHMAQHLLFTLVAAPLLALSAPASTLVRGAPAVVRRTAGRWRHRLHLTPRKTALLRHPAVAWLLYVGTLWFWHGAVPYDAALASEPLHVLSHATYLASGVLFWRVIVDSARSRGISPGLGVLLAFGAAMQSVFLSALLTFAATAWYSGYTHTTAPWGLEPLADQQLAGAVMWIPGGLIYLGTALALLAAWLREGGPPDLLPESLGAAPPSREPARDPPLA
jgi:putative membrane protein